MWQYQKTDELYHHGILGMKWGVRRFQNKNGTLTSTGKQRRYKDEKNKSNNKRMSTSKKVAIGAAIVGGTVLATIGAKKIYNYKKQSKMKKIKYNGYKKQIKSIIRKVDTQSAKDAYYTNRSLDRELERHLNQPNGGKLAIETLMKGGRMGRSSWGPRFDSDLKPSQFRHKNVQKALDQIEKLNKRTFR